MIVRTCLVQRGVRQLGSPGGTVPTTSRRISADGGRHMYEGSFFRARQSRSGLSLALRESARRPRMGTIHASAPSYRRAFQLGLAMLVAALGLLAFSASAQALPDGLTLTPEAAENPLGSTHTLTATVTEAGTPVAGVRVGFSSTST